MLSTRFIALKGNRKFKPRFIGPYRVLNRVGPQAYRLRLPSSLAHLHDVFHVSLLRQFQHGGNGQMVALPIIVDGEAEWEVERIVRHRLSRGKR